MLATQKIDEPQRAPTFRSRQKVNQERNSMVEEIIIPLLVFGIMNKERSSLKDVLNELEAVQKSESTFAVAGPAPSLPAVPGLVIEGVDHVSLS